MSAVPWFSIVLALGLRERGRKVWILWDDTGFGPDDVLQRYVQASLGRVLARLPGFIERIRLSEVTPVTPTLIPLGVLRRLVELNSIWRFRGENRPPDSVRYEAAITRSLHRTAGHLQAVFQLQRPETIIVPGGMYGSSGLFVEIGRKMGIRVESYDSGPGIVLLSTDGIAAWLSDIPLAFHMLPVEDDWVIAEAEAELGRRMRGPELSSSPHDVAACQPVPSTEKSDPVSVLLPLNQSYDTSALGRHRVFKNQTEWMMETVAWVLENSSESIVIRRHPAERISTHLSNENYEGMLINRFGHEPRVRYVAQDALVNTYDLICQARVIVPYVSTIGLEATALGKPVVTQGASCYADLGFVWCARTRNEYFSLIERALAGELVVTEQHRCAAWRCYYLTQCCNFLRTSFTPMPEDFDRWVSLTAEQLLSLSEVSDTLEALDGEIPLSMVRHFRRKHERQAGR